jgi:hypothetical protein
MTKGERLLQLSEAIAALSEQASARADAARARIDEARDEFEAARGEMDAVKNSQLVFRKIREAGLEEPAMIRTLVQGVAEEERSLQPLLNQLAARDAWWSDRTT